MSSVPGTFYKLKKSHRTRPDHPYGLWLSDFYRRLLWRPLDAAQACSFEHHTAQTPPEEYVPPPPLWSWASLAMPMYYEHDVQAIGLEGSRWPGMYPYRFEILSPKPSPLDPKIKTVQYLKDAREIQISGLLMPVVKGSIAITKEEIHEVQQRSITNIRPRDTILAAWSTSWTRDPKPA